MPSKPSSLPDWATTASGSDITAPSGGKQATGWVGDEFPPHNYFNWWQNLVGQWVDYLDAIVVTPTIIYPSLVSGAALATGYGKPCYWVDTNGAVHIEGTVKASSPGTDPLALFAAGTLTGALAPPVASGGNISLPCSAFVNGDPVPSDLNAQIGGILDIAHDGSVSLRPVWDADQSSPDEGYFGHDVHGYQFSVVYHPSVTVAS